MSRIIFPLLLVALITLPALADEPIRIGSRRELLVDDHLIAEQSGDIRLVLHRPAVREIAIVHDAPWEGNSCGYHTVFQDGDLYRMYYKCYQQLLRGEKAPHDLFACYAESHDGIHWTKPNLGIIEFQGSKENNIIWEGFAGHDFTPFKDPNPDCKPDEEYKAVGVDNEPNGRGLYAFKSTDGVHWTHISKQPFLTKGAFDSQNLVFWDTVRGEYRVYFRDFKNGIRDIKTAVSKDFKTWSEPEWLEYPGAPTEQLYTNQIIPYYRAPHIFVGFPSRYIERGWCDSMEKLPRPAHRRKRSDMSNREGMALTDGLFMSSRDGRVFKRWGEAFIRPGLRTTDNWVYGDNYQNWGLVETKSAIPDAPNEISVYATEAYWMGTACTLRRFSLRVDGFVSMQGTLRGGEFTTKRLVFDGKRLSLNMSTSAAGTIRVEIQDANGKPIPGYSLEENNPVFGDSLDHIVTWKGGDDLSKLAGKPVRLRFTISDADLYSFGFH